MYKILLMVTAMLLCGCSQMTLNPSDKPDDLNEIRRQAADAYQQKDYVRALPLYQRLTKAVPADAYLWFRLGNAHARMKQPDRAIDAYQRAVVLDRTLATPWYNMAILQLRQAANSLTQMLQSIPPGDPLYSRALSLSERTLELLGTRGTEQKPAVSDE